jgi:hypothetical protein
MNVFPYSANESLKWDVFCQNAIQATFLHTQSFLAYHKQRFEDHSLILEENGEWVGIFPAAINSEDGLCVCSHPGITFGGLLHQGYLKGGRMIEALTKILMYYKAIHIKSLVYKAVPSIYHKTPAQDDLYALFRLGAIRIRCDLSCAIDLNTRLFKSERRKRGLRKAEKAGVTIVKGANYISDLWEVITANLNTKYGVDPVHNLQEITFLIERFPNEIQCICAKIDNTVIAGTLLFVTPTVYHAQYIAANEKGKHESALDMVFENCIAHAKSNEFRWFNFGTSNEKQGSILNNGLFNYKSEFGGGGIAHEFYKVNLETLSI